jgi:hypothetical protein
MPRGWEQVTTRVSVLDPRLPALTHACSSECKETIQQHGVKPPAPVTMLHTPGPRALEEALGGASSSPFLGALVGSFAGSIFRDFTPSGWARPAHREEGRLVKDPCHYFVNGRSLCGEWDGYRGAVRLKPTLNKVCETCKTKEARREARP